MCYQVLGYSDKHSSLVASFRFWGLAPMSCHLWWFLLNCLSFKWLKLFVINCLREIRITMSRMGSMPRKLIYYLSLLDEVWLSKLECCDWKECCKPNAVIKSTANASRFATPHSHASWFFSWSWCCFSLWLCWFFVSCWVQNQREGFSLIIQIWHMIVILFQLLWLAPMFLTLRIVHQLQSFLQRW